MHKAVKYFVAALLLFASLAFAQHNEYQIGILQTHVANTERIGTDFNGINCDGGRCVGSAAGIYQNSNWWNVRVGGADGYWEMQPNWQENSGHNPLNTAKEGDKVLFRITKRHYLNGTFDVAYLPRADNPKKEIMLMVKWVPDHPILESKPQPKSQLEAMCAAHRLTPEQEASLCSAQKAPEATSPTPAPVPSTPAPVDPMANLKRMCDSGMFTQGIYAKIPSAQQQCDALFPKQQDQVSPADSSPHP